MLLFSWRCWFVCKCVRVCIDGCKQKCLNELKQLNYIVWTVDGARSWEVFRLVSTWNICRLSANRTRTHSNKLLFIFVFPMFSYYCYFFFLLFLTVFIFALAFIRRLVQFNNFWVHINCGCDLLTLHQKNSNVQQLVNLPYNRRLTKRLDAYVFGGDDSGGCWLNRSIKQMLIGFVTCVMCTFIYFIYDQTLSYCVLY